ncbi:MULTISPECIES: aminoacyl-tRNA hydrolase [Hoeflea]|uniref:Peptidyl-tRNA hydrolase n=1 Tax=Hoeflea alexandrii TaxID=288436 RepID=A0ABT1CLT6_9HYPH|nr:MULTISPECIES: aminoacyl-tRNA hydrolase [Hoeflea]MCO6407083.1 aminoacyl-tRNA hydrolase [Hoeflea alexandrii]VVT04282.1 Peptidyl-tRNA hydrolase [Hoeflea sp. EC-HK425]
MLLIAGLGNPGPQYARNRHNVGFMAVDAIARRHSFSGFSKKFRAEIAEGTLAGEKALIIKPMTFMNLSGDSVGEAMRFYKLSPADIIVIHDELDLAPGKLKLKTGGGNGGHNGLKSIDAHCGKDYKRLRIGIGHPGHKDRVNPHVLGDFAKSDQEWLEPLLDAIADHADLIAKGDDAGFLNKIALATGGAEAKPAKPEKKIETAAAGGKPAPAGKSHIRQARNSAQPKQLPTSGPMADMLKKLFGNKD